MSPEPRAAPYRIVGALDGTGVLSLAETYQQIVDYLRSNTPLDDTVRQALADAIERGGDDSDGVRLKIEAHGLHFKQLLRRNALRSLLDAAAWIVTEHKAGNSYKQIYVQLPNQFPAITDGVDYGRRARKLFNEFIEFAKSNNQPVVDIVGAFPAGFDSDPLENDDYFVFAAMQFCEQKVGMI
jgi:hypothetical protein